MEENAVTMCHGKMIYSSMYEGLNQPKKEKIRSFICVYLVFNVIL